MVSLGFEMLTLQTTPNVFRNRFSLLIGRYYFLFPLLAEPYAFGNGNGRKDCP
jgi:hypothetical protein